MLFASSFCLLFGIFLAAAMFWSAWEPQVKTEAELVPVKGVVTSSSVHRIGKSRQNSITFSINGYPGMFGARVGDISKPIPVLKSNETVVLTHVRKADLVGRREGVSSRGYGLTLDGQQISSVQEHIEVYDSLGGRIGSIAVGLVSLSLGLWFFVYALIARKRVVGTHVHPA